MKPRCFLYEVVLANAVSPALCDKAAVIDCDSGVEITWRELSAQSERMATAIVRTNDDKVPSVLLGATYDPVKSFFLMMAAWRVGAMYLPVNPSMRQPEVAATLRRLVGEELLVVADESKAEWLLESARAVSFSEIHATNVSDLVSVTKTTQDDFQLGLLTSGSTGDPKLIRHSAWNLFRAAEIELKNDPNLAAKRIFNIRPHFTSGGCNSIWPTVLSGGSMLFSREASQISRFGKIRDVFNKYRVDLFIVSPSMLHALLDSDDEIPLTREAVAMKTYYGGMSLPERVVDVLRARGLDLRMRYGMTEIAHIVSTVSPSLKTGLMGKPYADIEVMEKDGYLWFRGDGIASSCRREAGWFKSDDLGSISNEGEILLHGREQAIVNVNGFRFPLDEPTRALALHPSVEQVVVLAKKSERLGAELVAFYHSSKSSESIELELRKLAQENLSNFKRPVEYVYVQNWPYTDGGKTDVRALWSLRLSSAKQST